MAVFPPIHLLIAVCLCGFSSPCHGQYTCSENDLQLLIQYATPKNNRVECRRSFHGPGAQYSWTWYVPRQRAYYPIPADQNVTIINDGTGLLFDYNPSIVGFKCDIQRLDNIVTGPILFDIFETRLIQTDQGASDRTRYVDEYSFLSLECTVKGTFVGDDIYFSWRQDPYADEGLIKETDRVYVDGRGNLNFSPVLKKDETLHGTRISYYCQVNSPKLDITLTGHNVLLDVVDASQDHFPTKPLLHYASPNVTAKLGHTITLECVFSNDDRNGLTYKWYQTLVDGEVAVSNRVQTHHQTLTIFGVEDRDRGYWYCAAENRYCRSDRHGIYVDVIC